MLARAVPASAGDAVHSGFYHRRGAYILLASVKSMGCSASQQQQRPASASTILKQPGCEWMKNHEGDIEEICRIVSDWKQDKKGAEAATSFKKTVLKTDWVPKSEKEVQGAGGLLGEMLGEAIAVSTDAKRSSEAIDEVHERVDEMFQSTLAACLQMAQQNVVSGTVKEVYENVKEPTLTGNDVNKCCYERVRVLEPRQDDDVVWFELALLCLSIEILHQIRF